MCVDGLSGMLRPFQRVNFKVILSTIILKFATIIIKVPAILLILAAIITLYLQQLNL